MNKYFTYATLVACFVAASCKKEDPIKAIEKKLVGTWLCKDAGSDKNGNHIYDTDELDPNLTLTARFTIRFNPDHSHITTWEPTGPNPQPAFSRTGKWEVRKEDPSKIIYSVDSGTEDITINSLTETEFIVEETRSSATSFARYIKQ